MKTPTLQDRLNELVRSTFLGFLVSVVVLYFKPELQTTILGLYGILAGKRAFEIHATSKASKGDSNDDK